MPILHWIYSEVFKLTHFLYLSLSFFSFTHPPLPPFFIFLPSLLPPFLFLSFFLFLSLFLSFFLFAIFHQLDLPVELVVNSGKFSPHRRDLTMYRHSWLSPLKEYYYSIYLWKPGMLLNIHNAKNKPPQQGMPDLKYQQCPNWVAMQHSVLSEWQYGTSCLVSVARQKLLTSNKSM